VKSVLNSLIILGVVIFMTFGLILLYKLRCYYVSRSTLNSLKFEIYSTEWLLVYLVFVVPFYVENNNDSS